MEKSAHHGYARKELNQFLLCFQSHLQILADVLKELLDDLLYFLKLY
jgi:hypothetical protein